MYRGYVSGLWVALKVRVQKKPFRVLNADKRGTYRSWEPSDAGFQDLSFRFRLLRSRKGFGVLTVWGVGWWFRILRFKGVHRGVS